MRFVFLPLILLAFPSFGLIVTVQKSDSVVNLNLDDIELPPTFDKSIKSGFSNVFILQLNIFKNGKAYGQKEVSTKVIFDLWEEVYFIRRSGASESSEQVPQKENVLEKLKKYKFLAILPISEVAGDDVVEVKLRVIVDPISKEKQKKIKSWLAENQVNIPGNRGVSSDSRGGRSASPSFETVKRSVFNQVLDSELDNETTNGEWVFESEKMKIKLKPEDSKELKNAK